MRSDPDELGSARAAATRTATCSCGQLRVTVHGEPLRVGICHCLACQRRTGSVFGVVARFHPPYEVDGEATEFVRVGDEGTAARFRFCPRCGATVFYTPDGRDEPVAVPVGAFADPTFPSPQTTVYANRKHRWVLEPPGLKSCDPERERDATQADVDGVREVIGWYFEGHATGDASWMTRAFLPTAHVEGLRDDRFTSWTLDDYRALFAGEPAADEATRTRTIDWIDVSGDAATAKATLVHGATTFVDYFLFLKVDGRWAIANKVYRRP